ncbi:hypothetical protein FA95DRAFT_1487496 [Auriscalpium vulgare]|uniref:Uncharacterized protein n=1 Tax=Auriscalpium vulgare TaxID=40419 RepID=A0ACB8S2H5_9AGAM|nr:hypothetical protein FA95DRAFT_1487496 [Auriscalpium vulgare]
MADATPAASVELPRTTVRLPRHLAHPETKEISKEVLAAVEPGIAEVPLEYIHGVLYEAGPSMLKVLGGVQASPAKDKLPKELSIIVNDLSAEMPTHMVAVYSRLSNTTRRRVTLYPIHNVMFATHCANLPALPPSHPTPPTTPGSRITVPVVPLCLPSPPTFPHLSAYLYGKRADVLLASLLPCAPPAFDKSGTDEDRQRAAIKQFASKLAATYTPHALLQHAMRVNGLWRNACVLGVFDDALWATIDLAWEVLLYALAIATGNPQAIEVTPVAAESSS